MSPQENPQLAQPGDSGAYEAHLNLIWRGSSWSTSWRNGEEKGERDGSEP